MFNLKYLGYCKHNAALPSLCR